MEIAIIGGGSIGMRHKRILETLGHRVLLVSRYQTNQVDVFPNLGQLFVDSSPDYVIVANETYKHDETIRIINESSFAGLLLIEKPLNSKLSVDFYSQFKACFVGFNLRFNPMILRMKELVGFQNLETVGVEMVYGNSTSNWRGDSHGHKSYSRSRSEGGGVLRDFCHEIDLAHWMFGFKTVEYASGDKIGDFMIDGEDLVNLVLGGTRRYKISIHLNSLQDVPTRTVTVRTTKFDFKVDLINSRLTYGDVVESFEVSTDYTYQKMHEAIINGDSSVLATINDGLVVDRIIDDAELFFVDRIDT